MLRRAHITNAVPKEQHLWPPALLLRELSVWQYRLALVMPEPARRMTKLDAPLLCLLVLWR